MRPYRGMTKNGKWVYGWYVEVGPEGNKSCYIFPPEDTVWQQKIFSTNKDFDFISGCVEVIPETVAQQIGLKDKNGKEIYEGDIYKDAQGIISVVKMAVDGWALFPVKKGTPVRNLYWHNVCVKTQGEIIGNIHEPELLEKNNGR